MGHIHPPKLEIFDLAAGTNTDPKGFVRQVDEYQRTAFGLYMARSMPDHHKFTYLESWFLPELGLRVTEWQWRPEAVLDQDFYIDIVDIETGDDLWRARDLYLDIVLRQKKDAEVLDTDELIAALAAGLIDFPAAERALENTFRTVTGIAKHGHDLDRWLATHGIQLHWKHR
ncbi:DUF402 domain-containing protein [Pseudonocardiaceae bacterium YIM PH 21723]|nr:DUF402 domain-containing protein [Pseudonocardiaceae bacterium YIM PH 21723]